MTIKSKLAEDLLMALLILACLLMLSCSSLLFGQELTFVPATVQPAPSLSVVSQGPTSQTISVPAASNTCARCGRVHLSPASPMPTSFVGASSSGGSALAMANERRRLRGLPPFRYNPALQQSVNLKARIQARMGRMHHPGGGQGPGSRGEGVGVSGSTGSFITCYLYSNYTHAAAASVQGRNGQWYHCLQVSGAGSIENQFPSSAPRRRGWLRRR